MNNTVEQVVLKRAATAPWSEAALAESMRAEGFATTRHEYGPGSYFPPHDHENNKCDAVIQGCLRLEIKGVIYDLMPGDRIYLPARTMHDARVIGKSPVISLDGVLV